MERHCISLGYGLMRLVLRGSNPNKETLIYIPLPHVTVIQTHTTDPQLASFIIITCLTLMSSYVN